MVRTLRWLLVGTLVLAVLPGIALAQDEADPVELARALVDAILAEDYTAATVHFNDEMQAALPAEKLQETWGPLAKQLGPLEEQLETTVQEANDRVVVTIPLRFTNAAIDVRVSVTADGQIGGLFFAPHVEAPAEPVAEYEAPEYVDPDAIVEQDVTIHVGSEAASWNIPGVLTRPVGKEPFAAVVLVHGSGPGDRDETIGPNKPFRDLAWGLASQGIAVLRYDKRTYVYGNESAVDSWMLTVQEEVIDDAVMASDLLRNSAGIDPERVFVLGHSLGGYLAPWIAQQAPDVAGVIVMAGNARPLEDLILVQGRYLLSLDGTISDEEQAALDDLEAQVQAVRDLDPDGPLGEPILGVSPAYWLALREYDPVATAQSLAGVPMLFLQGERDYQVTDEDDLAAWQAGLSDQADVTFITYPALNHLFLPGEGPSSATEYEVAGHIPAEVINDIAGWIDAH